MNRKITRFFLSVVVLVLLFLAALMWRQHTVLQGFSVYPLPVSKSYRLFDIGVSDVNEDGWLDIYTSNHHFRQVLLMADGKGGYMDRLSDFGLDQSPGFPRAELAFGDPVFDKPGLYLFWFGTNFVLRSKGLKNPERYRGTLSVHDWIRTRINSGFRVDIQQQADKVSETRVSFVPNEEGRLVLDLGGQGLPLVFDFEEEIDPSMIFVGHGRVSPPSAHFSLAMQDRHAMAWSDYDHDGRKDVFIDRGALGGRLRAYPEKIIRGIHDELLVSGGDERYTDISTEVGFDKNGCSGRHARWVDFDGDGRLDLFINCYNRHNVMTIGDYPKQLYHRGEDGRFRDVATEMGLGVPHIQFGSLEFVDLDHDGDQDYVAVTDDGVVVFKNNDGHFFNKEVLFRREKVGDVKVGDTTGDRWLFDGKLTVADYESDGDLDFFVASKRGNVLLRNEGDSFDAVALESHGLPASSMTGNWVDYDNDGRMDLHLVPQGLYRQQADGSFEETGLLAFPEGKYRAAIGNWADLDNDGHMDVLLALSRDPDYTSWLDLLGKKKERPYWELKAYLNTNRENHWLEIELAGPPGNPEGIGARITVSTPSGQQTRQVGATDGAFFSQGNYRLHFGLGNHDRVDVMKVEWPGGKVEIRKDLKADQFLRLNHG